MLQPVLLTNENQKQGLATVIEEKASIYDFKEKLLSLHLIMPQFSVGEL